MAQHYKSERRVVKLLNERQSKVRDNNYYMERTLTSRSPPVDRATYTLDKIAPLSRGSPVNGSTNV